MREIKGKKPGSLADISGRNYNTKISVNVPATPYNLGNILLSLAHL